MQIETFGRDVEVTPALKQYVQTRLERLNKHFSQRCQVRVTLSVQKNEHHVEAHANLTGHSLHTQASGQTMYAAIDVLADKLDRLIIKHKEKKLPHASHALREGVPNPTG